MENQIIVKVQLPIRTNAPVSLALIYDEFEKIRVQIPVDAEIKKAMGDEYKRFFFATVDASGVKLGKQAPWQDW